MARDFARKFYNSKAWRNARAEYKKSVGGLCERCLAKGLYNPAEIIHHKTHITPDNILDPFITLSWDNLEALCRDCHAEVHDEIYTKQHPAGRSARYKINDDGSITVTDEK